MDFLISLMIARSLTNSKLSQDMVENTSSLPASFMPFLSVTDSDISKL